MKLDAHSNDEDNGWMDKLNLLLNKRFAKNKAQEEWSIKYLSTHIFIFISIFIFYIFFFFQKLILKIKIINIFELWEVKIINKYLLIRGWQGKQEEEK